MNDTIDELEKSIATMQRQMALLKRLPMEDEFSLGTVIRYRHSERADWTYFVKSKTSMWSRPTVVQHYYWGQVTAMMKNAIEVEISTGWNNLLADPKPTVEISHDGARFVLTDTVTGDTWERKGSKWKLVEEDEDE